MNRLDNFKNKISLLLKLFQLVQNTRKSREKILVKENVGQDGWWANGSTCM